nr:hypothetical protein [Caulobacteraceae bacterium]
VDYENSLTTFFKSFIDDRLATIGLVTIENEEDSGNNYREHGDCTDGNLAQCDATAAATASDYAAQLLRAVTIAHGFGLKVANGGFSSSGIDLWYWYYLYHLGLYYEADQYALYAFAGVNDDGAKASNLPSLADPNHATFPGNPAAYLHMMQITDMVALIKASGIDYVSVHFLSGGPFPGPKYNALQALVQAVRLPPVSDAIGIKQDDAGTTWGVLDMGPKLGMPIASWFGGAPQEMGIDRAFAIADPVFGHLNDLGHLYHCVIVPTATNCP